MHPMTINPVPEVYGFSSPYVDIYKSTSDKARQELQRHVLDPIKYS